MRLYLITGCTISIVCLAARFLTADNPPAAPPNPSVQADRVQIRSAGGSVLTADRLALGLPAAEEAPSTGPVRVSVKLFTLDWLRLKEKQIDLAASLHALEEPRPVRQHGRDQIPPEVVRVKLPATAVDALAKLLVASETAKVVSSPTIITQSGRAATVQIGREVPVLVKHPSNTTTIEWNEYGTQLRVVPTVVGNEEIFRLQILAVHSEPADRLGDIDAARFQAVTDRLRFVIDDHLRFRHSYVIVDGMPSPGLATQAGKQTGTMLVVTPSVSENVEPVSTVDVTASPQPVAQSHAKTPPVLPHPAPEPDKLNGDLHQTVRELRSDVRELSRDVKRLLKLLEGQEQPKPANGSSSKKRDGDGLDRVASFQFNNEPLDEVIRQIARRADRNSIIDVQGLKEEGISLKHPVTLTLDGVRLKNVLHLVLEPLGLAYVEADEVIQITSRQRALGPLTTVNYPVGDLVADASVMEIPPSPSSTATPDGRGAVRSVKPGFAALRQLISDTIEPDSWDERGGPASIRPFETTLSLVIRQTKAAHAQIRELLGELRELRRVRVGLQLHSLQVPADRWENVLSFKSAYGVLRPINEGRKHIVLSNVEAMLISEAFQNEPRSQIVVEGEITVLNGQLADLDFEALRAGVANSQELKTSRTLRSCFVRSTVAPDRRGVRLNFAANCESINDVVGKLISENVSVGRSLLVDVTDLDDAAAGIVGIPIAAKAEARDRLFKRTKAGQPTERVLMLITPRIVVEEEEEVLLPEP